MKKKEYKIQLNREKVWVRFENENENEVEVCDAYNI